MLENIRCSEDIKKLSYSELDILCNDLRNEILKAVSKNGGHLASNLGSVELTVAIHRVYNTAYDRIVFDVGHQSYSHKMITGRLDKFNTLRKFNGLSGFPKPCESNDDSYIAGHASNSVAVALGMARARTIRKENYNVACVIGDGALTGGLAYEGLTNAGGSGEAMVIILNDNAMSINNNVGGIENLLSKARVKSGYIEFKRFYRHTIGKLKPLYNFNHKVKENLKKKILPSNMFDDMGLYYLGPVNGHNIKELEIALNWAKELNQPVLLHVLTQKGKGYKYAEEDPSKYHGVNPFDIVKGINAENTDNFSKIMGHMLCNIATENSNVVAITAAMEDGTGLSEFAQKFPNRFFDVGIAEETAITMSGGMAKQGLVPVVSIYSTFLQRAYDQLIHDISLLNLHVVFCVDRAGIVGSDGETHQGVFDINFLTTVPGLKIYCPSNYNELQENLNRAVNIDNCPVAIRYPRGKEPVPYLQEIKSNKKPDLTIVTYGILYFEAIKAQHKLMEDNIYAQIIKLDKVFPLDYKLIEESVLVTRNLIVLEDICQNGCIGEKLLSKLAEEKVPNFNSKLLNLGNGIVVQGTFEELANYYQINSDAIVNAYYNFNKGEL